MCDHSKHNCESECHGLPIAFRYDLHQNIDKGKVTVLNEAVDHTGIMVFKSMIEKDDSDCDEELLFNIPFDGHIKVLGLCICGEEGPTHPAQIRLFKDRPAMSFDDCQVEADQIIDLKQDPIGSVDYPLKVNQNFGSEKTRVFYIGLRGEYQHGFRPKIAIATYEARPLAEDHKGEIPNSSTQTLF